MAQGSRQCFLELSHNRDVDRCWVGLRDCSTAFTTLPDFLQEDLWPVVSLMVANGWRRLSLSLSPSNQSLADGRLIRVNILASHDVCVAARRAVHYLKNLEHFLIKRNILDHLDGKISQIEDEIARLVERLVVERQHRDELMKQMRDVTLDAAISSAGLEIVFELPSQSARDRASQPTRGNRHRRGRAV